MTHKFTNSTNLDSMDYNLLSGNMIITFKNKKKYSYDNVRVSDMDTLKTQGGSFVKEISNKYGGKEIK